MSIKENDQLTRRVSNNFHKFVDQKLERIRNSENEYNKSLEKIEELEKMISHLEKCKLNFPFITSIRKTKSQVEHGKTEQENSFRNKLKSERILANEDLKEIIKMLKVSENKDRVAHENKKQMISKKIEKKLSYLEKELTDLIDCEKFKKKYIYITFILENFSFTSNHKPKFEKIKLDLKKKIEELNMNQILTEKETQTLVDVNLIDCTLTHPFLQDYCNHLIKHLQKIKESFYKKSEKIEDFSHLEKDLNDLNILSPQIKILKRISNNLEKESQEIKNLKSKLLEILKDCDFETMISNLEKIFWDLIRKILSAWDLEQLDQFKNMMKILLSIQTPFFNAQIDPLPKIMKSFDRIINDLVKLDEEMKKGIEFIFDKSFSFLLESEKELLQYNRNLKKLQYMGESYKELNPRILGTFENLRVLLTKSVEKKVLGIKGMEAQLGQNKVNIANTIFELYIISSKIDILFPIIKNNVSRFLSSLPSKKRSVVCDALENIDNPLFEELANSFPGFEDYNRLAFLEKTGLQDEYYAVNHLSGDKLKEIAKDEANKNKNAYKVDPMRVKLLEGFKKYYQKYSELVSIYKNPNKDKMEIVKNIRILLNPRTSSNWARLTSTIPEILAHIFSMWTIEKTNFNQIDEKDDEEEEDENEDEEVKPKEALMKPHPIQVISILRLLGYDQDFKGEGNTLKNHLIQIGTGEGKSVTLAATSIFFALCLL